MTTDTAGIFFFYPKMTLLTLILIHMSNICLSDLVLVYTYVYLIHSFAPFYSFFFILLIYSHFLLSALAPPRLYY